jgi:Flp pilus assembly pilin Flp
MIRLLNGYLGTFMRRQDGVTAVSYAIILALVVVAVLATVALIGGGMSDIFTNTSGAASQ